MAELVDEHVRRPQAVGRHRPVLAEDAPAAVGPRVGQDLDEVVRREGGHVAKGAVVEGQNVALAAERVVGRADARAAVNADGGARDARFLGGRTDRPDIEVGAAALEGLDGEEEIRQAPRVLLELPALGRRIAVAEDEEVHLLTRLAVLLDRDDRAGRRGRRRIDVHVFRVHDQRPDLAEGVLRVPLLERDLDRRLGSRKPQRLREGAAELLRLPRRLPLAVDRREPAGVDDPVRGAVDDLEEVLSEVRGVDRLARVAGPGGRLDHDAVEAERLRRGVAGVEIIHPHGAERPLSAQADRRQDGEKESRGDIGPHEAGISYAPFGGAMIYESILGTIGNTPVVRIHRLAPEGVTMYVKCEAFNPLSSVKDRLAIAIIEDAERTGQLKPGQTVIEATSGNTGIALAMVCAAKGYPFVATMVETFSVERRKIMRMLGAKVILTPAAERGTGMVRT